MTILHDSFHWHRHHGGSTRCHLNTASRGFTFDSLIRHARLQPRPPFSLCITVVLTPFRTISMALASGLTRPRISQPPAFLTAISMAPVVAFADVEGACAPPARPHAKRVAHTLNRHARKIASSQKRKVVRKQGLHVRTLRTAVRARAFSGPSQNLPPLQAQQRSI